jgi:hypothetical protein
VRGGDQQQRGLITDGAADGKEQVEELVEQANRDTAAVKADNSVREVTTTDQVAAEKEVRIFLFYFYFLFVPATFRYGTQDDTVPVYINIPISAVVNSLEPQVAPMYLTKKVGEGAVQIVVGTLAGLYMLL